MIPSKLPEKEQYELQLKILEKKGKVKVELPNKRLINLEDIKETNNLKPAKIHKEVVDLSIEDQYGRLFRVTMKIKDLAKKLNVSEENIQSFAKDGTLDSRLHTLLFQSKLQTKPEAPQQVLDPDIRNEHLAKLKEYGLTQEEFETIETFYINNKEELDSLNEPTFIRRDKVEPPIARSLVYVPEGPRKGMYVLLKTHGGAEEIGLGAFNRVTLCVHLDSAKMNIFRNAKKEHVSTAELEANKLTADHPGHFAAGIPVIYLGPWRARAVGGVTRKKNEPKDSIPREENVQKAGFIMDFLEGGELFDRIGMYGASRGALTYKQMVNIAWKYADALAVLHEELELVHFDQKIENTLLTKDLQPRITDFGYTVKIGEPRTIVGTPGYIAPELVESSYMNLQYFAHPSADIWSMGCVFADLNESDWFLLNGQKDGDYRKIFSHLDMLKDAVFSDAATPGTMDWVIDHCLLLDPQERPTARNVADYLKQMYDKIP